MKAAVAWAGLRYAYAQGPLLQFDDFVLPVGQHLLLRGGSGTGKSTLLALLAGLLTPSAGSLHLGGAGLHKLSPRQLDAWRGANLGFVPQRLHLSAALSVNENLSLPYVSAGLKPEPARAAELLDRLGLSGLGERRPHRLSVGQAQRVALARALMRRPPFLLVDEPTASLDDDSAAQVIDLLLEAALEQSATLVLATHDGRIAERVLAAGSQNWRELRLPTLALSAQSA
ncbi:ATP-binding cassette domain-containing protein [Paucibacter sp. TC2R-5]|uniref:ABC transporter ATP-binding protein n=1 Tax=Paucibacter sp. TC2R-5 TaxID=2893555 RepID=UPI0021E4DBF5|nr:ATP-binding cassette domain-containing protein [Paucibacter sp. TC2R-5]MCV2358728.1 ATP-binding cassette domain-containing protein [Paucibacter sp. TC2R-5]